LQKSFTKDKSGALDFVTGVGTQIKTKSACFILEGSEVNSMLSLLLLSLNLFTFSSSMSKANIAQADDADGFVFHFISLFFDILSFISFCAPSLL
jgi:hypothetical protein